ncbi:hypothetical protein JTE90_019241 [Oedothorax gibbosus]|uniref:Uncharacterized protein n=1 Tax=Oedothorax gibbosus TaxID=931172 RepID=A0AAV6UU02_9ARAC|nr:hypothetical protein JTE90_019241 [Oedothorax gibbosus]
MVVEIRLIASCCLSVKPVEASHFGAHNSISPRRHKTAEGSRLFMQTPPPSFAPSDALIGLAADIYWRAALTATPRMAYFTNRIELRIIFLNTSLTTELF